MSPPSKPSLAPLKTSKSKRLPSEIHVSPLPSEKSEAGKRTDTQKTPISPPQAYTEYLTALTPVLTSAAPSSTTEKSSDRSASAVTSPFFSNYEPGKSPATALTIPSPSVLRPQSAKTPKSLRPLAASPITESPRSASHISPLEWSIESGPRSSVGTPRSASFAERRVRMRQVITRTVTCKRTPLDPAPKGKRRKVDTKEEEKKS